MQLIANRPNKAEADQLLKKLQAKFPDHEFEVKDAPGADKKVAVYAVRVGGPEFTDMRNLAQEVG